MSKVKVFKVELGDAEISAYGDEGVSVVLPRQYPIRLSATAVFVSHDDADGFIRVRYIRADEVFVVDRQVFDDQTGESRWVQVATVPDAEVVSDGHQ